MSVKRRHKKKYARGPRNVVLKNIQEIKLDKLKNKQKNVKYTRRKNKFVRQ